MAGLEKKEKQVEKEVIEVTNKLKLDLPGGNLPIFIKLIAALTAIGGLSVIGGLLTNVFTPGTTNFWLYIARLTFGITAIASSYAIIKRSMWSIWFYVILVIGGLISNPITATLPLIVLIYLFILVRHQFSSSPIDLFLADLYKLLKKVYQSKSNPY